MAVALLSELDPAAEADRRGQRQPWLAALRSRQDRIAAAA